MPLAKGEKYSITDLSLLRQFWRNNYASVIMTAEADSLTTDAKPLLELGGMPLKKEAVSPCKN